MFGVCVSCAPPNAAPSTNTASPPSSAGQDPCPPSLDTARQHLRAARTSLDTATTALSALLYCAFTPYTWLALPIGLGIAAVTITFVIPARAQVFGELLEAAFDTHRSALYTQ